MLGWGGWPAGGACNGDKFTLYWNFALKEGGGGGGGGVTASEYGISICNEDLRLGLTTGGSGSSHSAWELGGESHNPDSVCTTSSACDGVLRGIGSTDYNTAHVSRSTSCLKVDDVPSGWSASRWWSPRDSYAVAESEVKSSKASGWAGSSCGIHER